MGVVAQAQTVSGLVTSDDGPLPGATIVVKGTNNGTTADFDGNFSISAGADDVLVVSFVGFTTQEVAVGGQDQITISLAPDNELEEVVVTGYGSQRSKEITSAVVKVDQEEFNRGTINNANQLLQGKVAGLSIYNRGGDPNSAGDWSLALPDVNIIRARSGAAALTSIDADEFLAERGREMFQESTRRSDQIRFGQYVAGSDSGRGTTVSPAHKNVMPIPLDAINAANGTLTQNQGY